MYKIRKTWVNCGMMKFFSEHPASVGETYFEHLLCATGFSIRMIIGGIACFIHALLPFLFVKTASKYITELHEQMVRKRSKLPTQTNTIARKFEA